MSPDNVVFVMDASIGQACEAQARAFKEKVGTEHNDSLLDVHPTCIHLRGVRHPGQSLSMKG